MSYSVLHIYKDLPQTNCKDCQRPGCFPFATAVFLEGISLSLCPHLSEERIREMEAKLGRDSQQAKDGDLKKSSEALTSLCETMKTLDLVTQAEKAGGTLLERTPPTVELLLFGSRYQLTAEDVQSLDDPEPTVWVKIFLYIYLTRATGTASSGRWVTFRELPNTMSKAKQFDEQSEKMARHFQENPTQTEEQLLKMGATKQDDGSADASYLLHALPKVPLRLSFWRADEEFSERASLLLDASVLDYLDQEALVFLAEALAARLSNEGYEGIIP